ncbi:MAG TPA: DNA-3-methyladenine glycosylase I [Rhabdochlamydiaceae bacterium]|nr:DNA-3-methyladenine glycosylase I [Rhabdochlamydiaceae bacterium]
MKRNRCKWAKSGNSLYEKYHDTEWGIPVHDDRKHFEFLILEGAQAGLSWITILKRREGYRRAFAQFDPKKVAKFNAAKIKELLADEGIIRNKLKIESAINNAKLFLQIQKDFGSFDHYVWQFVGGNPIQNSWETIQQVPAETKESKALSSDLRKRGFKFVGPTVMYAYMQATGLVNDHTMDCFCHSKEKQLPWEVYIIQTKSGKLYTGITTDLKRRFADHQKGKKGARFFRFSEAEKILFHEPHQSRSQATKREIEIKKMSQKQKLALINQKTKQQDGRINRTKKRKREKQQDGRMNRIEEQD